MTTTAPQPTLVPQRKRRPDPTRETSRVYAEPVHAHLKMLTSLDGVTHGVIAKAANLPPTTVSTAVHRATVQRFTAEILLAVTPERALAARAFVPAGPSRDHLNRLLEYPDVNYIALAAAAGMHAKQITEVLNGSRAHVKPETEKILLALTPRQARRNATFVSTRVAITRLRALQANGHTPRSLGRMLGLKEAPYWLQPSTDPCLTITQERDRDIERLYSRIGDQRGPSRRAARAARALGYYPPIHYDDDMNLIRESIVTSRTPAPEVSGSTRARDRLRILGLTLREHTAAEIATMLRCSEKKVERARKDVGLRLESTEQLLADLPYVKRGQDELVALIAQHTADIQILDDSDVLDGPDLDYVELWKSLVDGAKRYAVRAEYVALWESLLAGADTDLAVA